MNTMKKLDKRIFVDEFPQKFDVMGEKSKEATAPAQTVASAK